MHGAGGLRDDGAMSRRIPPAHAAPDPQIAWKQLVARDRKAAFFYGVKTTGVFCRPGCASRCPLPENVRFFATAEEARAAGFRPCLRCGATASSSPLDKVRAHIERHYDRPMRLAELGRVAGLSPFTVQRNFKREMGVSPLAYQRALRAGCLRAALKKGCTVTQAVYDAGFSSPSRAYESVVLGMTPARFAKGGKGETIGWCSARTRFGWMMAGATARGLCWLSLAASAAEAEADLRAEFPAATIQRDKSLAVWIEAALESVGRGTPLLQTQFRAERQSQTGTKSLDIRGTVFQLRVWQALRRIPRGETRTYSQLAREMGEPGATRAVARACAVNRVALLVPCHRVIGADGSLTGYRWGVERKQAILEVEKQTAGR